MLRVSKLYNPGFARSSLAARSATTNTISKRCESTLTSEPKKKSGSFGKVLFGTTLVGVAGYAGAAYYATQDKEFHRQFTTIIPGGREAVVFIESLKDGKDLESYREQALAMKEQAAVLKQQAEEYAEAAKEAANNAYNYANDAYLTLSGQKPPARLVLDIEHQQPKEIATDVVKSSEISLTSDKTTTAPVVEIVIEQPKPIVVKQIKTNNKSLDELSSVVCELASILNDTGLAGKGRDIIERAEKDLNVLADNAKRFDSAQSAIVTSLEQLKLESNQTESELQNLQISAEKDLIMNQMETINKLHLKDVEMKEEAEKSRAAIHKDFAHLLAKKLNEQKAELEQKGADALAAQANGLQRQFMYEVKLLVENERAVRLDKLENVSERFKALEEAANTTVAALDRSRRGHLSYVNLTYLQDTANNRVKERDLAERFEIVAKEARRVALVPLDGGFGAHILSFFLSTIMFKKHGLVEGDDLEAVLSRTGHYLKTGDLDTAVRELNQLQGWPKVLAFDWLEAARRHLESKQAMEREMHGGITIVVLGASGDLASKKTFPCLFGLYKRDLLPEKVHIIGYARSKLNREEFVDKITRHIKTDSDQDKKQLDEFLGFTEYMSGTYDKQESFKDLDKHISELEQKNKLKKEQKNRLFYMALPPSAFLEVASGLSKNTRTSEGTNRLIIEKPFGKDLSSCNKLNQDLAPLFDEKEEVFRIDHYLGKEMIKNITTLRFSNMLFSPLWSGYHIQSVQITLKENFGTEGRGGYFDEYGIIRDVMQNHLLQLMSVLAMERPIRRDADAIRDEKVKLLRSVKPIKMEDCLLGQYVAADGKPGYLDDETVPKGSLCPTYAALVFFINNERWDNVPFIMRAGKAMETSKVEVRIQFKALPGNLFEGAPHNELVIRIQPNEAIYIKFNNKTPGLSDDFLLTELDLTYKKRYTNLQIPDAYESLLLDAMRGDRANFVRDDELRASWEIFTPLLHRIEKEKIAPEKYPYGSRGPACLSKFMSRHGVIHTPHVQYQWPVQDMSKE
ncbi:glucose-6-phosphate dehydrogenase [Phycomyces nitens]|nr:glucose-6-phosphate dehydrogenase [Phycomyces nitens]